MAFVINIKEQKTWLEKEKIQVTIDGIVFCREKSVVGKEENTGELHFLLFSQYFQSYSPSCSY